MGSPSRTPPFSRGVGGNKEWGRAVPCSVFRTQALCHLAAKRTRPHPARSGSASSHRLWRLGGGLMPSEEPPAPGTVSPETAPSHLYTHQQPSRTQHCGDPAIWGSVWPPSLPTFTSRNMALNRSQSHEAGVPAAAPLGTAQQPQPPSPPPNAALRPGDASSPGTTTDREV